MKAKREHQVASSDAALAVLDKMPKDSDDGMEFTGTKGQPLSDMSLTALIRRMNGDEKPVWVDTNGANVTICQTASNIFQQTAHIFAVVFQTIRCLQGLMSCFPRC